MDQRLVNYYAQQQVGQPLMMPMPNDNVAPSAVASYSSGNGLMGLTPDMLKSIFSNSAPAISNNAPTINPNIYLPQQFQGLNGPVGYSMP